MKTTRSKRALALLLVMLLCFSVIAPAVSAESVKPEGKGDIEIAASGADGDTLEKRANGATLSRSELISLFDDSALSTAYYGFASADAPDSITYVTLTSPGSITAGDFIAYKTTAATGSFINRQPNWNDLSKRTQLNFAVKTYYTASFTVEGSSDGALYLNGEPVNGSVNLYTDENYLVTAQQVEGFSCEVTGVTAGVEFTPTADMTITAVYTADASASISLTVGEGGAAGIISDGEAVVGDTIPAGKSFTIEATPNTNRGYKLDSIVVKKNGEEIESGDGVYGPVADQDVYEVTVSFAYDPPHAEKEINANDGRVSRNDLADILGSYSYYGIAPASDPDDITQLIAILRPNYDVIAGEYIIYGTNENTGGLISSPIWTNAKITVLDITTYYNGTFTVNGNDDGEVYLNGEAVTGAQKLYTDTEYTVTAKAIDDYVYSIDGAEDGVAFTPSSNLDVTVNYLRKAYATFTVNANDGGTVAVRSNGDVVTDRISEGDIFTIEATPNTNRGYKLDSIVVKKNGEEIESGDGAYGPVADQDVYEITVTFTYDPPRVEKEVNANDGKVSNSDLSGYLGSYSYYGIAKADSPDSITYLSLLNPNYNVQAGEYIIYGSNDGNILSPNWTNAKLMALDITTYYNGTFTVNGNDDGVVYLNGEAVTGTHKLYTDKEYTVTAKNVNEYEYTMEGAQDGAAFTPTANVTVTVTYTKLAYATFSVRQNDGGIVTVRSNDDVVTDRISEGDTFTIEAAPNTDRGYKLDKIVVVNGEDEITPNENGEYGPVHDAEQYYITVTFKFDPDVVEYEMDANSPYMTTSAMSNMFSGTGLYSYGYAKADAPEDITTATLLGETVTPGDYIIYRTSLSLLNPDWSKAKVLALRLRMYYNGTFTVTAPEDMPESGALYLNGDAVTGACRLYTDTEYTVTAKPIDEYIYTVYGATEGEAFTPASDVEVSAVYMKETYATVTVNANEGGTVKILSDGEEAFDKIPEGKTFTVNASANASDNYYIEGITVTKDGEEIESGDGVYGPVVDKENYEVTVTFKKAMLSLADSDVILVDIKNQKFDEIRQSILDNITLTPEAFADQAQFKVEYAAYKVLGYDIYEPLNYTSTLSHAFGTSELGGELLDGNTEKVRVTCTIPSRNIEMTATATVTVRDIREATKIEGKFTTITYGDDLKTALMGGITVTDSSDNPIEFTAEDITVSPESLNVKLLSAQEVTIRYNGADAYAASENTVNVYVRQAQSSIDTKSETITYGETPKAEVRTTPEDLDYIKIIGGIDGDAKGFVSIDIPGSVKDRMQIKVGDLVLLDIYQILSDRIGEGSTINDLKNLVLNIYDRIDSSEIIRRALENSGFDMEILDNIMSFIEQLPDVQTNLRIRLGQAPENAGAYLLFAISADTNYTLSSDVSTIIILPKTDSEDVSVELRFRSEIDPELNYLTYEQAQDFIFGGDFYLDDVITDTDKLHTLYTGTTLKGEFIAQETPVREPGIYTETIYLFGGNYAPEPIIRTYTINRIETELKMDDLTVAYDGSAHTTTAYLEDGTDISGNLTYIYTGSGYAGNIAPGNAGEYTVYAYFRGDDTRQSATATATLTITKLPAAITLSCAEEVTYGDINLFNVTAADLSYEVTGTIEGDTLGFIVPVINGGDTFPNVGEYNISALFYQTNPNYDVTVEDATLKIVPKSVIIKIDDAEKKVGKDDPEFTFTATDADGNELDPETLGVTLTREAGETVGAYEISVAAIGDPNYALNDELSTNGTLTIFEPAKRSFILGDVDGDGEVTASDVTLIQRTVAHMNVKVFDTTAADVDGDGDVTSSDSTLIQRYLACFSVPYAIGNTQYEDIDD